MTATPEEVTTEEGKFKAILFLIRVDDYKYVKLFEDIIKADFVGRDEYPETLNGAYELLVSTSSQFGGIILSRGRRNFRSEHGRVGRTSVLFKQAIGISDQGGHSSTPGSSSTQRDTVPGRDGRLYSYT